MENFCYIVEESTGRIDCMSINTIELPKGYVAISETIPKEIIDPYWDFKNKLFFAYPIPKIELTTDEIESKIADLKEQMGKELAVTDWYYIRRLETMEEVPNEIQEERTSIREKFETEINNLTK